MPTSKVQDDDILKRKDCLWVLGLLVAAFTGYWGYSTNQIAKSQEEIKRLNEETRQAYIKTIENNRALINVTSKLYMQKDSAIAIINNSNSPSAK